MGSVEVSFADLDGWRRAETARHLGQTRHMSYGCQERFQALYFRLPFGDPAVTRTEPPAVLLAQLRDAAAGGGSLKLPKFGKGDTARMSELLRQSADRAGREARDGQVTEVLGQLWRAWDAAHKVPAGDYERTERMLYA